VVAIVQGQSARDLLTKAWASADREGLARSARDHVASESSGWKVKLDCLERNCLVEYIPYHVLTAEFFGAHVCRRATSRTSRSG